MDKALNKLYREIYDIGDDFDIGGYQKVYLFNTNLNNIMRDLGPMDIDKLISITGLCVRNSEIIPDMKEVIY
jgi:DNA replicative helicase MCM subunit Mcm2 (Cdc46/Mcm family)